jgi:6-phosphogluconolactonase
MENESKNREIVVLANPTEVAQEAARRFEAIAKEAIERQGRFTVALSGGSTPKVLYNLLAEEPCRTALDWKKVYFFFGDERTVPPDHADSNYRMAHEALLSKIETPPDQIYRMRGEDEPGHAAEAYCAILREFFGLRKGGAAPENFPRFDLVLLGMGPDGHTASLFPNTAALEKRDVPATANYVPQQNTMRLTLTFPSINRAANVLFLVTGKDKAEVLKEVLHGEFQPQAYPSQLIQPTNGKLTYLMDKPATEQLDIRN